MSGTLVSASAPRPRALARRAPSSNASGPLGIAAVCVLALGLVWLVAELVPAVAARDASALYHFTLLSRPRVDELGNFLLHLLDPGLFVLWGAALAALA